MRRGRLSLSASGRGVRGGYRLGCLFPLVMIAVLMTASTSEESEGA
jgi:hypothetical protein